MYRLDNDQIWLQQMKYKSNFLECHHIKERTPNILHSIKFGPGLPTLVFQRTSLLQGTLNRRINAFCRYYDQNVPIPLQIFMDSKMHSTSSSSRSQITCIARQSWGRLLYKRTSFLYGNKNEDTINDTDIISKAHYILVYVYTITYKLSLFETNPRHTSCKRALCEKSIQGNYQSSIII